jgi:hypothetical protein
MRTILAAIVVGAGICAPVAAQSIERRPFTVENLAKLDHLPARFKQPRVGVALSGGGSKAASYAMGVLAGLHDAGLLGGPDADGKKPHVDIISSVSGGGYSAYFLFSRMLDAANAPGDEGSGRPEAWFRHCLTVKAQEYFGVADEVPPIRLVELLNAGRTYPTGSVMNPHYCPETLVDLRDRKEEKDVYRFQNHLGGFQDFLSPGFNYSRVGSAEEGAGNKMVGTGLFFATLGSLPAHWAANIGLSFGARLSPIQHRYEEGFLRAYGYRPSIFTPDTAQREGVDEELIQKRAARGVDPVRLQATREAQARFGALSAIYTEKPVPGFAQPPLWIVNVTASDRAALDTRRNDPLRHIFELTTFGFGSPCYGLFAGPPNDISIPDAMAASAAFLDWQQRSVGGWSPVANTFIYGLNAGMGFDYPNPRRSAVSRALSKLAPLPFVWSAIGLFPGCVEGNDAGPANFRFSDGGQSENTGLLPLIRRRVPTIVFADASQDTYGRMEDLCVVAEAGARGDPAMDRKSDDGPVRRYRWRISVEGLPDLDKLCADEDRNIGYDILDWRNSVLVGAVRIHEAGRHPTREGPCAKDENDAGTCLRLFLLKPAIDLRLFDVLRRLYYNDKLDHTRLPSACHVMHKRKGRFDDDTIKNCKNQIVTALRTVGGISLPPPGVIRFVLDNWEHISKDGRFVDASSRRDNAPNPGLRLPTEQFPQSSTFSLTLNSSPSLYEAYRDLARAAAGQVGRHIRDGEPLGRVTHQPLCRLVDSGKALDCPRISTSGG